MVKNLAFDTKKDKLEQVFGRYGNLDRVLLPTNNAVGVVSLWSISDAKNAFELLQGYLINKQPMYLEWAPENFFNEEQTLL